MEDSLKLAASAAIRSSSADLSELGSQIWQHPELKYEEHRAHSLLTDHLEGHGFTVERGYCNISTAFRATYGSGAPNLCVICEYDALPHVGHACGHNLIAELGVAAGIAIKAALEVWLAPPPHHPATDGAGGGGRSGRVTVLGTPGEEGGGGKLLLMRYRAFEDIDVVVMAHPAPSTIVRPLFNAVKELRVEYRANTGANALDAAVTAYNSVGLLRQQIAPACRVHLVIQDGGKHPGIVPESSLISCYVKAPNSAELSTLETRVRCCFESAAVATDCRVRVQQMNYVHANIRHNPVLASAFARNYGRLLEAGPGAEFADQSEMYGSTDMIRVSDKVPTLYPVFAVGSGREVNHAAEFAGVCDTPSAHASAQLVAEALAHTCVEVLVREGLRQEVWQSFEQAAE